MKITRRIQFLASSEAEAIKIARKRLGRDAVILSTRVVKKGGIFGLFSKKMLEVTAAILEPEPSPKEDTVKDVSRTLEFQKLLMKKAYEPKPVKPDTKQSDDRKNVTEVKADNYNGGVSSDIKNEVLEIKNTLKVVLEKLGGNTGYVYTLPPVLQHIHKRLIVNDVASNVAEEVIKCFVSEVPSVVDLPTEQAEEKFVDWISKKVKVSGPFRQKSGKPKVVVFVGPTGVGKTTTIAKLAAIYSLYENKNVVLVTADTYRVAAVEQLRTYARIIGIPIEVAFAPKDLSDAINRHSDADFIFIDTAGRSQRDNLRMSELKAYIEALDDAECQLVIAANAKYRDILEVLDRFGIVPISGFIFTKLDETNSYGTILNLCWDFKKPVSYLTTGQDVPNDIEIAETKRLGKLIIGLERVGSGG